MPDPRHNARTELRGEGEVQEFKAVVLGEAGGRVMDIGDGQGEVRHAVDCIGWRRYEEDPGGRFGKPWRGPRGRLVLRRDAPVFRRVNMRRVPGAYACLVEDRRASPEDAAEGLFDAAMFENIKEYSSLVVVDGAGTGEKGEVAF